MCAGFDDMTGGGLHPEKAQPEIPESAAFRRWIADRAEVTRLGEGLDAAGIACPRASVTFETVN